MKRIVVLSFLCTIIFTGSAFACHFNSFTPNADCNGWSVTGSIYFSGADYADLTYAVTLSDAGGTVASFNGSERIYDTSPTFSYGSPWGMELCGDYTATGSFSFTSSAGNDVETFTITFRCICDEPDGCTGTPGYWKNHPGEWPVSSLTLGGVSYDQTALLGFLDTEPRGDKSAKLIHHTIAAKLNVLYGNPSSIQPTIDLADTWIAANGLFSHPTGAAAREALEIKNLLVAYNESDPCGEPVVPMVSRPLLTTPAPNEESRTWGSIKKLYE